WPLEDQNAICSLLSSASKGADMRRREFVSFLGGTLAILPAVASAQKSAVPVIGFVNTGGAPPSFARLLTAFYQGLTEGGYVEGRNVAIEYRWAGGEYDRLPELLDDLIRRKVDLIFASGGLVAALYAKAATERIPIVFIASFDPVKVGLVASLNRPGG